MKRLLPFLLLFLASFAHATTYYIAATGSDSNNGTSKTTPWLHAPKMPQCSSVCNSTTINAGDSIIFEGGGTWHFGNSSATPYAGATWPMTLSGSSANCQLNPHAGTVVTTSCIYIGVDQTWYAGGSWVRPVLTWDNPATTAQVSSCTYNQSAVNLIPTGSASYVIFDNLEITGWCWTGSAGSVFNSQGNQLQMSNLYFHGWSTNDNTGSSDSFGMIQGNIPFTSYQRITDDVFDGSDSTCGNYSGAPAGHCAATGMSIYNAGTEIDHNIFNRVSNGCICTPLYVHDNLFMFIYEPDDNGGSNGTHGNIIEWNNPNLTPTYAPNGTAFYNNVFHDTNQGEGINMVVVSSTPMLFFNNVSWLWRETNTSGTNGTDGGNCYQPYASSSSTMYFFNNTLDYPCGDNWYTAQPPEIGQNIHFVGFSLSSPYFTNWVSTGGPTATDNGDHVVQTEAAANAQGYTSSNAYAPTSGSGATVGAGGNLTSLCNTFDSVTAAACKAGAPTITYNTSNHTASFTLGNARPSTGPWDTGAYQFSNAGQAASPSCSPGSGNYASSQTVTCTNPNSGTTVMCYTTNGSTPVTNGSGTGCTTGTQYTTTVSVSSPETLEVVAGTSTLSDSAAVSYSYTFTIATPTFSPTAGHYTSSQTVTITAQSGATICYTIDGSTPAATTPGTCSHGTSLSSGGTITVSASETVKALGTESGLTNSSIATAVYTIGGLAYVSGGCSIQSSGAASSNSWTFSCTPRAINDAVIFDLYCHPTSGTITAVSLTASGWSFSQLVADTSQGSTPPGISATFGALAPNTSATTFTATFTSASNCSNLNLVLGAEFSGNNTTGGSTTFDATGTSGGAANTCNQTAANVTPTTNNNAIWFACVDSASAATSPFIAGVTDGGGDMAEYQNLAGGSGVAQTPAFTSSTGPYVVEGVAIAPPQGSAPTFSPIGGTYSSAQTITIGQAQSLAMCYTTNGSTPTSNGSGTCVNGTLYSSPITVSTTETVNAIGMASGWNDSPVGSASYTISGTVNPPTGLTATLSSGNGVLNWTASTTSGVTYNIYRGTALGLCTNGSSPYATGISLTTYTDTSVRPGVNYFYDVSAVSGASQSSCNGPALLVVPPSYPVWSFSNPD